MPASRMFSAISFGVFCRDAAFDQRDHAVEEGVPGRRGDAHHDQSDSTCVPPVTAERSPPLSRITGADSPVIAASFTRGDALDHLAVGGDDVAGRDHAPCRPGAARWRRPSAGAAVRRRAAVGHRLGAGAAQAWPPGPCRGPSATASAKLANSTVNHSQMLICDREADARPAGQQVADQQDGGQHGDDLDHEHHRVAPHQARIELAERLAERGPRRMARVEQR